MDVDLTFKAEYRVDQLRVVCASPSVCSNSPRLWLVYLLMACLTLRGL